MRPSLTLLALALLLCVVGSGCTLVPHEYHQPQYHNPWPQLRKVAVGPFYNLSEDPTLDQQAVAQAYFNELQQIHGFEVVPVGTTLRAMQAHGILGESGEDYQRLARILGVDAVVVGSVNDYTPYYPPRMALTVRWYTANPCFHPMPNGYGLPWGRAEEEYIPDALVEAAEFDLATAQLATQTPAPPALPAEAVEGRVVPSNARTRLASSAQDGSMPAEELAPGVVVETPLPGMQPLNSSPQSSAPPSATDYIGQGFPPQWPDPRGFIPDPPKPICDECRPSAQPVLTHTRSPRHRATTARR